MTAYPGVPWAQSHFETHQKSLSKPRSLGDFRAKTSPLKQAQKRLEECLKRCLPMSPHVSPLKTSSDCWSTRAWGPCHLRFGVGGRIAALWSAKALYNWTKAESTTESTCFFATGVFNRRRKSKALLSTWKKVCLLKRLRHERGSHEAKESFKVSKIYWSKVSKAVSALSTSNGLLCFSMFVWEEVSLTLVSIDVVRFGRLGLTRYSAGLNLKYWLLRSRPWAS